MLCKLNEQSKWLCKLTITCFAFHIYITSSSCRGYIKLSWSKNNCLEWVKVQCKLLVSGIILILNIHANATRQSSNETQCSRFHCRVTVMLEPYRVPLLYTFHQLTSNTFKQWLCIERNCTIKCTTIMQKESVP